VRLTAESGPVDIARLKSAGSDIDKSFVDEKSEGVGITLLVKKEPLLPGEKSFKSFFIFFIIYQSDMRSGNYLSLFEKGFSGDLSVFILTPDFLTGTNC